MIEVIIRWASADGDSDSSYLVNIKQKDYFDGQARIDAMERALREFRNLPALRDGHERAITAIGVSIAPSVVLEP